MKLKECSTVTTRSVDELDEAADYARQGPVAAINWHEGGDTGGAAGGRTGIGVRGSTGHDSK